ncbi:MAG: 4-hydroxythreonine-4-phosphate dehydrogenase [Candidatus Electronema aureum]|uniref:4-hydroxythreonine-4-phosphate dehydrogenase n=1 Tax=Candidatus Electronema aureum TaxID=2005002 RepID=A0A521FZP8_9BACT|nr:MAG: 4-hydroxythreonine-4-phosphate dehydrogenase [Candidatus Electronema aureum]
MKPAAITMGCPVGVGPEIILGLFDSLTTDEATIAPVVLGDLGVLHHTAKLLHSKVKPVSWQIGQAIKPGTVPVLELSRLATDALHWGQPTKETSLAMAEYIRQATQGTLAGDFAAVVTCPISKKALNEAGIHYPGHTEMLADLTGARRYRMMMAGTRLRVVLVTIHEPLAKVSGMLSAEGILDCIRMTADSLHRDFALDRPRIAVAGFNPHSGEQGMFGREEIEIIEPALRQYEGDALITGPWPPDTVFHKAANGEFDAVVCMYHDQGLIPFKLLHFKDGVNVTLGLPIVRTSVDHGTAYDIAGKGIADTASLRSAWQLATAIATNRARK